MSSVTTALSRTTERQFRDFENPPANDRIGGWQLMYQMLQKGEWQIADTCPKLIEAIPSRMHDEKKPGDVLKVPVIHWMTWPTTRAMESTPSSRRPRSRAT